MTPEELGALYLSDFDGPKGWSTESFRLTLADAASFLVTENGGFLLGREIAGEAEVITLVVPRAQRQRGIGRALLTAFEAKARDRGATEAFLEVSADNAPARALYAATGWAQVGHRRGYYSGTDALILRKAL